MEDMVFAVESKDMLVLSDEFIILCPRRLFSFVTGIFDSGNNSPFGSLINISAEVHIGSSFSLLSLPSSVMSDFEVEISLNTFGAIFRNLALDGETFWF